MASNHKAAKIDWRYRKAKKYEEELSVCSLGEIKATSYDRDQKKTPRKLKKAISNLGKIHLEEAHL